MKGNNQRLALALGIIVPNLLAVAVVYIWWIIIKPLLWVPFGTSPVVQRSFSSGYLYSTFTVLPILMGMVEGFCWRDLNLQFRAAVGYTLLTTLTGILIASLFLREGVVCLVIVSPLLFGFIFAGWRIGTALLEKSRGLKLSVIPLVVLAVAYDVSLPHLHEKLVEDSIVINARPATVWRFVPSFPEISAKPNFWLFSIGMVAPVKTSVEDFAVGARRVCEFSGNLVFDERIREFELGKKITFDILKQPREPEIFDHVIIERGQMELVDNGDGTTTLTGRTWYRLKAFPVWYFEPWADEIGRAVHYRVLEHIKQLAESTV